MRSRVVSWALCVVFLAVFAGEAASQDGARRFEVGATLGLLFEGEAYLAEIDRDVAVGSTPLLHVNGGLVTSENFVLGGYANLAIPEIGPWTDGGTMVEVGLEARPSVPVGTSGVRVAVPLNLGIRRYDTPDEFLFRGFVTGDWVGLGTNAAIEGQYGLSGASLLVRGQLGFLAQPLGGNDETDVTFAPIYYLAVGLGY